MHLVLYRSVEGAGAPTEPLLLLLLTDCSYLLCLTSLFRDWLTSLLHYCESRFILSSVDGITINGTTALAESADDDDNECSGPVMNLLTNPTKMA